MATLGLLDSHPFRSLGSGLGHALVLVAFIVGKTKIPSPLPAGKEGGHLNAQFPALIIKAGVVGHWLGTNVRPPRNITRTRRCWAAWASHVKNRMNIEPDPDHFIS